MSTPSAPTFRPNFRRGGDAAKQAAQAEPLPNMPEPRRGEPKQMPSGRRANKYGAKCINCQGWVEGEAGMLAKTDDGKWAAEHIECPSMVMEAAALDNLTPQVPRNVQTMVKGEVVYDGTYTYETTTAHRTFRLRTQALDDPFMPGRQIIAYLNGPDNERDYVKFGHIQPSDGTLKVWKKHEDRVTLVKDAHAFMADPHGPNVLASIACYACGRKLTVPESVHNGYGPECAKRFG